MSSRERILGRVRRALADVPGDDTPYERAVCRDYLREHGERTVGERVDLLAENLADYRAVVHRTDAAGLAGVVAGLLAARGASSVLVPSGLDEGWLAATEVTRVPDRAESTPAELDRVDSVVTACAVAVAETGTLVLDGSPTRAAAASPSSPTITSASSASPARSSPPSRRPSDAWTRPAR
ncbi:hypothetical protein SHKM778_53750 [Streptomyces sp. KM77-8]|uniref:Lactate utilization protein C n=1 Tax=Streptomyces haneummycinicus TaxID=3074435 RepID=A0AAT9HNH2_9ACTN